MRKGVSRAHCYEITYGIFLSTNLNRIGMKQMCAIAEASPFSKVLIKRDFKRLPDDATRARLQDAGYSEEDIMYPDIKLILEKT